MQLYVVTLDTDPRAKDEHGVKHHFLVKDAFDNSDAIAKVRRSLPQAMLEKINDYTFKVRMVTFNQHDVYFVSRGKEV